MNMQNPIEGRLTDIPYHTSLPLLFVYSQTAALTGGAYNFPAGTKTVFTPSRPLRANNLYLFKTMDFALDVAEIDFLGAITNALSFSMYVQGDAGAPALREPIPLVKYYQRLPYILNIAGTELLGDAYPGNAAVSPTQGFTFNRLLGTVIGKLTQTPALMGKTSITATVVFTVQEITNKKFISDFLKRAAGHA